MSLGEADRVAEKKKKILIMRRRAKVLEMYNRGLTQEEMAGALGVGQATISRDIRVLSTQAVDKMNELFGEKLELECTRLISGIDGATKMVWEILGDKDLPAKQRMAALSLLLKCYEARKGFLPEVYSAKEYAEQRRMLLDNLDEELDALIKELGWKMIALHAAISRTKNQQANFRINISKESKLLNLQVIASDIMKEKLVNHPNFQQCPTDGSVNKVMVCT